MLLFDEQSYRTQTPLQFWLRTIHIVLFPKSPVTNFQITFLPRPWPSSHTVAQSTRIGIWYPPSYFFHARWITRYSAQTSSNWEDCPSLLSFRGIPEKSNSTASVHFWVVPAYHAQPSVIQDQKSSSSVNWSWGCPHESLQDLPRLYYLYNFHLMMEYCYACLTLWLGESDYSQFMIGSSGCKAIWWAMFGIQSLLRSSSRPRVVFQKRSNYLQWMMGLCSKIQRDETAVHF